VKAKAFWQTEARLPVGLPDTFPAMKSICFAAAVVVLATTATAADLATVLRRPIAFVLSSDASRLFVANRDSGTISIVALPADNVVNELVIGKRLSDLVAIPGTSRLLATDECAHELVLLESAGDELRILTRLEVSPYPVSVRLSPDGRQATVASLWSQRLTFVAIKDGLEIRPTGVLDLPFAPRCQLPLAGRDKLIVADSFGARLALVEPSTGKLLDTRQFPGHNIRGIGASPDGKMLIVAHQMLNDLAHSIRNDIHWGLLMSNDLRWLEVDSVLAGGKKLYYGAHIHPLGDPGKGGGDPGDLDVAANGTVCITLAGVDLVAFGQENDFSMQRVPVGRRPTAVRLSPDGCKAYVANTLDDSISVIDLAAAKVTATIPLGPKPELTLAQQGELLFYDARMSHDGWMSCHSCHSDGHANGERNDNLSDASFGAPKRVLSLLGVRGTLPLAWNGQVQTLRRQIENSLDLTMQREERATADQIKALAAYVETLEIPPSVAALRGTADQAAIERGRATFARHDCGSCHAPPTFTSPAAYDVGLPDALGNKEFNPPSLRGVSHRGPFFHDNSAETVEEVFLKHGHPNASAYSADEVRDLAAFLLSL
jgi:YVTN family beta-propeller protein